MKCLGHLSTGGPGDAPCLPPRHTVIPQRGIVSSPPPGTHRPRLPVLVHGVRLSMGYFIMLMMLGHASFDARDTLVKRKAETARDSAEGNEAPVCGTGLRAGGSNKELGFYQNGLNAVQGSY